MQRTVRFIVVVVLAAITIYPAFASSAPPAIAPIQSHPHDQTYSAWAAAWWQ